MKYLVLFMAFSVSAAFLYSCKTPAVITEDEGMMKADIGEGKVIYMRNCTGCHEQKVVEDFTQTQWSNILPRMVIKAKLNDTESRQVKAYIEWEIEND